MDLSSNKICGVILIGGKSLRMGGGIKSLRKFNNKFIFDRIFENIQNQVDKIIINSNHSEKLFRKYKVNIIKDKLSGFLGPLAGIHATLEWINNYSKNHKWIITVPGDTPFIPKNLVEKLYTKAQKNNLKIVIAKSNNNIHPIIGLWHASLFESLNNNLISGTRKVLDWAKKHELGYEEFNIEKYDPFFNINYEKDILKATKIENNYF